ncbi:hypothetical protein UPYG_G00077410 [Umbra pygmaea]|uniref:RRM domain-containing protein n=1 Tax=Umbra pygmaea TaxID=75934 RepID=A0ABD0XXK3_UMBPY
MAASPRGDDFEDYDKPGAERSRRRRGEDDDLDSDLEGDLLEEDWLTAKKNASDASDEELNDDLLQSDEEDQNIGQGVSLNATLGEFDQQVNSTAYTEDLEDVDGLYHMEREYIDEYSQPNEIPDDQMEYAGEPREGDDEYRDEVLDIQIDDEFQVDDYSTSFGEQQQETLDEQADHPDAPEGGEEEEAQSSQLMEEAEPEPEEEGKEEDEEDEEEEDASESGRLRFKTERKDVTSGVVRLADAANKRRNIPETLELSEEAKADLMEFEEKERQRRQGRFGGRGGRGGDRGGFRGRGGRGGFPGFGMTEFGRGRGQMNEQRFPMMALHMGMQSPSRMPSLRHQRPQQQHHNRQGGPRGPAFQEHGGGQQPLQPLMPQHMAHRSSPSHGAPIRPQMDQLPRMMSPPPSHNHSHQQQQHPKNIHINPHFRGPASSPAQVPLMPPAQSQPRPAGAPQRFPGPGEFSQHMPGNFGQPPQRPPHHMEAWRNQPPPAPQDREPFFIGESGRFPGQQQHMFDHQNPGSLMNSNHPSLGQGHMAFNQPAGFSQPNQGPGVQLGMFSRELPRPNPPPQNHLQGMASLTGHGGPPTPRPFIAHRQPGFPQQQGPLGPFPPQQLQFGMQVRMRGLMQPGPPLPQLQHHDLPLSHQQQQQQQHQQQHQQQQHQQHRQDHSQPPPHHHPQQHQLHPNMHHHAGQGQPPFHQQHGSPRMMHPAGPRPQNAQRNTPVRARMNAPTPKVLPQRNSNLRELPVAPGNQTMNNVSSASAPNVKPVARATQAGVRPGLNARPVTAVGRGRAQPTAANKAATAPASGPPEREVVHRDSTDPPPNTAPQDPEEDEETRQYRLKIEEQKRLREEILKRKEMRRQMQAGVRKKELLERISGQSEQQPQQQQQQQQPRPFPQKPQQQSVTPFPPNGTPQTPPAARQNVKTRLQMTKSQQTLSQGWQVSQQGQKTGPNPNQPAQWQQQQGQQRRNITQFNPIRPGLAPPLGNMPMQGAPTTGQGSVQAQASGLKSGVKRTVMQRSNSGDKAGAPMPQKVRVVKLLAGGVDESEASAPTQQQQSQQATRPAPPLRQGPMRKVTLAGSPRGQPVQGPVTQGGRGATGKRVVVPGRGRGRGSAGGAGQPGRGHLTPTRQSQRGVSGGKGDGQPCTVCIDGLSTSTTDTQLRNLLNSIGPIQMFRMLPQQRKAIASFHNPQHALSFQVSFNRHMIDLSHIDVSLIDG